MVNNVSQWETEVTGGTEENCWKAHRHIQFLTESPLRSSLLLFLSHSNFSRSSYPFLALSSPIQRVRREEKITSEDAKVSLGRLLLFGEKRLYFYDLSESSRETKTSWQIGSKTDFRLFVFETF